MPPDLDRVELAGNATVSYAGSIDRVRTFFARAAVPFSERNLADGTIAVAAGQKISSRAASTSLCRAGSNF